MLFQGCDWREGSGEFMRISPVIGKHAGCRHIPSSGPFVPIVISHCATFSERVACRFNALGLALAKRAAIFKFHKLQLGHIRCAEPAASLSRIVLDQTSQFSGVAPMDNLEAKGYAHLFNLCVADFAKHEIIAPLNPKYLPNPRQLFELCADMNPDATCGDVHNRSIYAGRHCRQRCHDHRSSCFDPSFRPAFFPILQI